MFRSVIWRGLSAITLCCSLAATVACSASPEGGTEIDRTGTLSDPFGHQWTIATHKEDVSLEEMQKRAAAAAVQS